MTETADGQTEPTQGQVKHWGTRGDSRGKVGHIRETGRDSRLTGSDIRHQV